MVTRVPQRVLDRLFDAGLAAIMDLPPKDPHNDDDENEGDEEDDDEEDEEPAVIREPDEWSAVPPNTARLCWWVPIDVRHASKGANVRFGSKAGGL